MLKKSLFLLFFFLVALPFVSSAQDVIQTNINIDTGYEIQYPKYDFIKQDYSFKLHTHLFNKSDGLPLHNDITVCQLHLYNTTGDHTFQGIMDYEHPEFEVYIDGANFTDLGEHAYTLWCNSSVLGGFVSGIFQVTLSGEPLTIESSISYTVSLLTIGILFALLVWLSVSFTSSKREQYYKKTIACYDDIGVFLYRMFFYTLLSNLYVVYWIIILLFLFTITEFSYIANIESLYTFGVMSFTTFLWTFPLIFIVLIGKMWVLIKESIGDIIGLKRGGSGYE